MCVCWRKMISSLIDPRDQLSVLLSYPTLDLSMGYCQIKSEPTMFVMLSYSWLIPRAYTIISFGLTNAITVFTWWWKSSDMEIPMSCCWAHQQHFVSPMIHVEHQPSVETFVSNVFVFRSWSLCLNGRSDFLEFMCIWCKLSLWVREGLFLFPLVPSQVSYACANVFYGLVD